MLIYMGSTLRHSYIIRIYDGSYYFIYFYAKAKEFFSSINERGLSWSQPLLGHCKSSRAPMMNRKKRKNCLSPEQGATEQARWRNVLHQPGRLLRYSSIEKKG